MAWDYPELITRIDDDKWIAIYSTCSRKIRNMLEGSYGKKIKKGKRVSLKSGKDRAIQALAVRNGLAAANESQMAEEVLKTWLYGQRPLLKAALDFFGIENDDGITEQELTAVEEASAEKLIELTALLKNQGHALEDIAIYLAFVKTKHFNDVPELTGVLKDPV